MCSHQTSSRTAGPDTPHTVAAHPEQGWSLLCDGAIVFDDSGELRPDGRVVAPRRATLPRPATATRPATAA